MGRKKLIAYMFLLLLVMGSTIFYSVTYYGNWQLYDYIMIGIMFFIMFLSYSLGLIKGLIGSLIIVITYAALIIAQSYILGEISIKLNYIWILLIPIGSLIAGNMGDIVRKMQEKLDIYGVNCDKYNTADFETGFSNKKAFLEDLTAKMAEAKRHKYPLSIGVLELLYYDELVEIHHGDISEIFKIIAAAIEKTLRVEDLKYRVDVKTFAFILPFTDLQGDLVLKSRIKEELLNIAVSNETMHRNLKFEVKLGFKLLDEKTSDAVKFFKSVEKELEYDV